ncbi:MAG: hypothetical protein K9M75_00620 [Phycisphaerae bacterium]|nr:hypothetical protein [Phycisphaerae bacterium]
MSKRSVIVGLVALLVLSLVVSAVMAADGEERSARNERTDRPRIEGVRGQRGAGGMAGFQERIMGMYKENLGVSDAEWKIIEPKLTKVMELSRESRFGGMSGMMNRGGLGARGGDRGARGGDSGARGGDRGARGGDSGARGGDRGARGGDRGARGGDRGPRGGDRDSGEGDRPENAIQKASTALNTVLENESSTNDQIKAKLLELRKAKELAQQALAAAQKDLKSVLTVRQEAKLVASGILN